MKRPHTVIRGLGAAALSASVLYLLAVTAGTPNAAAAFAAIRASAPKGAIRWELGDL